MSFPPHAPPILLAQTAIVAGPEFVSFSLKSWVQRNAPAQRLDGASQLQPEARARTRRPQRQPASQKARPALGQRQAETDAATGRLVGPAAAKRPEDGAALARRDARPAVLHLEEDARAVTPGAQPDVSVVRVAAVLAGV